MHPDLPILIPTICVLLSLDKTFVLFWGAYHVVSTVPYPLQGSQVTITPEKTLKRGFVCAHFSLHDPLSLSLSPVKVFLAFVFYNISALSYLPRARTSAPRRFQGTLLYCFTLQCSRRSRFVRPTQSSGVTSHYSAGSRARCPCPALQTPYIYTTSYY